jgi:hypothetical protein
MSAAGILARFSRDFGVPFLLGGRCVIADPLGRPGFAAIQHGLSVDVPLQEACDAQFTDAALWCDVTPAPFDHDAATLLYAAHDLFATTHPQATSFYARSHLFAKAATQAVDSLPRTFDPGRLLTRHLVVRRLFKTTRTDVHVKWWSGSESFYGEEPPRRLVAMPGLRRVQQQRLTQPMWRLALAGGDEELRLARQALLVAVLDASPLSRLLFAGDPVQKNLGFSLLLPWKYQGKRASPLDVLEDKRFARMVTDAMLADGLEVGGAAIALALLQGLRENTSPAILRRAAELCTHLALVACVIEAEAPGSRESRPLVAFADGDPGALNEASRVYWAVVGATLALGRAGVLDVPVAALPATTQPVLARLQRRLDHKRILAVSEPLLRELGRRLPRPPSSSRPLSPAPTAGDETLVVTGADVDADADTQPEATAAPS